MSRTLVFYFSLHGERFLPAERDFIFLPDYHTGNWNSETSPENTTKGSVSASVLKNVYVDRYAERLLCSDCAK